MVLIKVTWEDDACYALGQGWWWQQDQLDAFKPALQRIIRDGWRPSFKNVTFIFPFCDVPSVNTGASTVHQDHVLFHTDQFSSFKLSNEAREYRRSSELCQLSQSCPDLLREMVFNVFCNQDKVIATHQWLKESNMSPQFYSKLAREIKRRHTELEFCVSFLQKTHSGE